MGYKLRREVRDAIPPGKLTAAERLLVLEIADACSDKTRQGWPGFELLVERTDLSARSLQETLSRIGSKWIELRVELGKDRHGRPYYSHAGRRTTFRFPALTAVRKPSEEGVDGVDEEGATDPGASALDGAMDPGASTAEGAMDPGASAGDDAMDPGASAADSAGRCDGSVPKVRQIRGPLPQRTSQRTSLSPRVAESESVSKIERETEASPKNTPGHRAVAKLGVAEDLVDFVVAALTTKHSIRSPGWWVTAEQNRTLAAAVEDVLAQRRPVSGTPELKVSHEQHRLAVNARAECPHGDPGGNAPHPEDGWLPCPQCRKSPAAARVIELDARRAG